MRRPSLALVTATALMALGLQVTQAKGQQDIPAVAVMDFSAFMMGERGASVNLGKAISAMLVTEFSGRDGMRVVE